tara:strand:- start:40 stop:831 length:792 start_codon:yes stop_codon:yes gene_type:complete
MIPGCFTLDTTKIHFTGPGLSVVQFPKRSEKGEYVFEDVDLMKIARDKVGNPNSSKISKLKKNNADLNSQITAFRNDSAECKVIENKLGNLSSNISTAKKKAQTLEECDYYELRNANSFSELNDQEAALLGSITKNLGLDATYDLLTSLSEAPNSTTSIMGSYELNELQMGKYLVISEYIDNFNQGTYLKIANLTDAEERVDLSNNDFFNVPLSYLVRNFFEQCEENNRCPLNLSTIESNYEEYVKAQDDLEKSLERLKRYLD